MDTFLKVLQYDSGAVDKFLMLKDFEDTFKWHFDGNSFGVIGTNFRMSIYAWEKKNGGKVQVYDAPKNDNQKWCLISRGSEST